MLLGCCHCGEEESDSIPPSDSDSISPSSEFSDSVVDLSIRDLECGDCEAVPYRWKVTLAGWTAHASFPTHATCCGARNASFILNYHPGSFAFTIGGLNPTNFCRIWTSSELSKNHTASPPSCANAVAPLIAMGLRGTGSSATVIDLSIYTSFSGFTPIGIHSFTRQSAGQCFYSGLLNFNNVGAFPRCSHGTVTVEPAL
jgi:hypothetical protein